MTEYLLAFSSFYKAAYAQETLAERKILSALRKLPPGLLKSCGYGVAIRVEERDGLKRALRILERKDIRNKGVFLVRRQQGKTYYDKIYL